MMQLMRSVSNRVAARSFLVACLLIPAACTRPPATAPQIHRMGDAVKAGPLIYNVLDAEWKTQLGEGPEARAPKNRFLLVQLTVTNSGGSESDIPPVTLEDAQGNSHAEIIDGQGVPDWLGILRKLAPAETEQGRVLFDVPTGAYRVRVTDATPELGKEKFALIDLPLRMEPLPAPQLPVPSLPEPATR